MGYRMFIREYPWGQLLCKGREESDWAEGKIELQSSKVPLNPTRCSEAWIYLHGPPSLWRGSWTFELLCWLAIVCRLPEEMAAAQEKQISSIVGNFQRALIAFKGQVTTFPAALGIRRNNNERFWRRKLDDSLQVLLCQSSENLRGDSKLQFLYWFQVIFLTATRSGDLVSGLSYE